MKDSPEAFEGLIKALADDNRLRIFTLLKSGEQCACHLLEALPIGQSTLSHHMKLLIESGLVQSRKEGKWTYYSLSEAGCGKARQLISALFDVPQAAKVSCHCD